MRKTTDFLYFWGMLRKPADIAVLLLSLLLGLSACSDSKVAGGGSSGTEAGNAITAQIVTASASPASLARVRLMDSESLDGSEAYVAEADEKGEVTIEGVPNGDYTLEAVLNGEALQLQVTVSGDSALGKNKLKKMAKVSGDVGDKSATGTVRVRGMEHSAKVEKGVFSLDSLPEGPLSLVFIPDAKKNDTSSTYLKAVAGEKSTSSTFAEESRSLLLDDFQDSNYQNRFMPAHTYDGGWWYFDYAKENVTPDSTLVFGDNHIFTLENIDGNIVAHVAGEFGEVLEDSAGNSIWPWATVGIELGYSDKKSCNDISSVDSIAFRIKGSGEVSFAIVDANVPVDSQKIAQSKVYELTDEWTRVSFSLKKILKNSENSYKCVNQLNWDFTDSFEMWLDDIELIGGDRLSIWEK